MTPAKLKKIAVDALEDIKAKDIKIMDVKHLSSLFDFIIVASADSVRQTKALANNVVVKVKQAGGLVLSIEGEESGEWVLVDCGDLIVHVMHPATREYYNLEELWDHPPPRGSKQKDDDAESDEKPALKKKTAAKKPAAKKMTEKKIEQEVPSAARKKPVVKKPVSKTPTAKKPAAKKPAAKKVTAKKLPSKKRA